MPWCRPEHVALTQHGQEVRPVKNGKARTSRMYATVAAPRVRPERTGSRHSSSSSTAVAESRINMVPCPPAFVGWFSVRNPKTSHGQCLPVRSPLHAINTAPCPYEYLHCPRAKIRAAEAEPSTLLQRRGTCVGSNAMTLQVGVNTHSKLDGNDRVIAG